MTRKKTIVELEPFKFVDVRPVDDPACMRDEDDPTSAFSQFLLPKLKGARDEASREVLEYLKVENLSEAIAHTIQSLPASKTRKLRGWVEEANSSRVYVFCKIDVRKTVSRIGLMLTAGKYDDEILAEEVVEGIGLSDDFAAHRDFRDALKEIETIRNTPSVGMARDKVRAAIEHAFEEESNGIVEVETKPQFNEACLAMLYFEDEMNGKSVAKMADAAWKGAGIYDFYPQPPKFLGTLDEWVRSCAFAEAEYMLAEYYPDSGELKTACSKLRSA